jgi:hypothetical protein
LLSGRDPSTYPGKIPIFFSSTLATASTSPPQPVTTEATRRSRREEQVETDQDITSRVRDKERKEKKVIGKIGEFWQATSFGLNHRHPMRF